MIPTKEKINEMFDEFYLTHIVDDGDSSFLPKEDFKAFLHTIRESDRAEVVKNHYCCKYKTIRDEDFCDHCLSTLGIIKQ